MERKLNRIDIPWCNACQEKDCQSCQGFFLKQQWLNLLAQWKKWIKPATHHLCDICGKDDCDKIICGFTTCEITSELSKLKNFIRQFETICPYEIDEYGNITREPCGACLICETINDKQS